MAGSTAPSTTEVRQKIDQQKLEAYLSKHASQIQQPITIKQNEERYVLRKKPPGQILSKSAHAVEREFKILSALGSTPVPAPKAIVLCEDDAVIGTPFYIMEFLNGRIFTEPKFPQIEPSQRTAYWKAAIETLAALHSVDYKKVGLESYGKAGGFYTRQVKSLGKISETQAAVKDSEGEEVGEIPHVKKILKWFDQNIPQDRVSIVHGDYKIDNLVYTPDKAEVMGILDWELSTIGHPLSDLANLCMVYSMPHIEGQSGASNGFIGDENLEGIPQLKDLFQWYEEKAGWSPKQEWPFAEAFAFFRLAVITQGIAARNARGQASSEQAARYAALFPALGELCWESIEKVTSTAEQAKL